LLSLSDQTTLPTIPFASSIPKKQLQLKEPPRKLSTFPSSQKAQHPTRYLISSVSFKTPMTLCHGRRVRKSFPRSDNTFKAFTRTLGMMPLSQLESADPMILSRKSGNPSYVKHLKQQETMMLKWTSSAPSRNHPRCKSRPFSNTYVSPTSKSRCYQELQTVEASRSQSSRKPSWKQCQGSGSLTTAMLERPTIQTPSQA